MGNKKSTFKVKVKLPCGLKLGKLKTIPLLEVLSLNLYTSKSIEGVIIGDNMHYKITKRKRKKK